MAGLKNIAFGLVVTVILSMIAMLLGTLHPSLDTLAISIILGLMVSNTIADRRTIEKGINWAIKVFLPIGIGLYGAQIKFTGIELRFVLLMAVVIATLFSITYFLSKGLGLEKKLSLLLSTGLAICGASAIVVIAPLIGSRREDTSISLISILTVGLTGMLFYKFLPEALGLPVEKFTFLLGVTLPMLGQVKVASADMGAETLLLATNFKLMRVSFLLILAFAVLIFSGRADSSNEKKRFYIPWFMVMFFILTIAVNLSEKVASLRTAMETLSKLFLSTSLVAIGLSIDIDYIIEKGARPLISAFLSWGIVVLLLYLTLNIINV